MAMLIAYSVAEAGTHPGYSIPDGYWSGRLPWMGIVEALVVAGATACVVAGAATVAALGGWARRAAILLPVAMASLWWFFAWAGAGISGAACPTCPPPPFDPWAYAYSAPGLALEPLIVPAAAIALLALTIRPRAAASYISPS